MPSLMSLNNYMFETPYKMAKCWRIATYMVYCSPHVLCTLSIQNVSIFEENCSNFLEQCTLVLVQCTTLAQSSSRNDVTKD